AASEAPAAHAPAPVALHPLFLKLAGRRVLVVGAGPAVERKIDELVELGARVTVVAPRATERVRTLAAWGRLAWLARPYQSGDALGAWLVVSATGDPGVQRLVFDEASAQQTFVLALDDLEHGSAYAASLVRRPPFVIAISSSGEAPALSRLLRQVLERALPEERWVSAARALRARWRREGSPHASRFAELVAAFARDPAGPAAGAPASEPPG
ncbi:MAG TPA: bifunctional precorrin-2 dehydrogenase/sirohydrochlorin ferrochelatase, partial [Polyangiaceae bacterium]|nr:bifunctional precorrin-2 dehydrogenase/sirohydrochlorin ferrochelatase [Polyangiaceae bacterium]